MINVVGKWRITLVPSNFPGVQTIIRFRIEEQTATTGELKGKLINDSDEPVAGFELKGGHVREIKDASTVRAVVMSFGVSLVGQTIFLSGAVTGDSPLQFDGDYVRIKEGSAAGLDIMAVGEPGDTGTGGGSQTT
jgi:hypothetical protein